MQPAIGMGQWFAKRASQERSRPALTFEGTTWSYGELLDRVDRLGGLLRASGVRPGDRVAFLAFNHPLYLVTMFACAKIGAVFVPLNFRLTGAELAFILNDVGAETLVCGPDHRETIDAVRVDLACERYLGFEGTAPGWRELEPAMANAPAFPVPLPTDADDPVLIMYTSGTTGRPKGAVLTHGNLWWNAMNHLLTVDTLENDVHLGVAPMFHIAGLNGGLLTTIMKGGHVVLHENFDPGRFLEDVESHRATTSFAVPAMLLFISQHPAFKAADLSSLRLISVGGAPVPEPLLRLYSERGVTMLQGYGLTETAPLVTGLSPRWSRLKLGSAGRPPLLTEVRLVNEAGAELTEPNVKGEICVRGPNVLSGYWNRPDATREVIDDEGWFRTGDVGYVDEDGFYYICDRVKDMVISGGENVYPAEVEGVIYAHPAIAEVAVIGVPDPKWGETVMAVVALRPGAELTLEELQQFASERLARYKIPRQLRIVQALPRNSTGKVLKYQLRQELGKSA